MADMSSAPRDEPSTCPGSAGTAEATGCCANVRPWRTDTSEPVYPCRGHRRHHACSGHEKERRAGPSAGASSQTRDGPGLGHDQDEARRSEK